VSETRSYTRPLSIDPFTGQRQTWHYDATDDSVTVATEQDVTAIVEANKAAAASAPSRYGGEMHRVASIPMSVYWELKEKGILRDQKALRKWLNDPDNRVFRTRFGRV